MSLFTDLKPLARRSPAPRWLERHGAGRLAGEVAAGAAVLAAGGLLAYWLKERSQEEAEHRVLERDGAFSLRRYIPLVVAATSAQGTMAEALDKGFSRLYGYIADRDGARASGESGRRIAMTVPVMAVPDEHPGSWKIRFVMPRGHFRSTLPEPARGIAIEEVPGRTIAAVRFAGRASNRELLARKHRELVSWMAGRGFSASADPEFAGYNAPIIPRPARRSEWWIPVEAR